MIINKNKFFIYLICMLFWMGSVFWFSAQQSEESDEMSLGVGKIIAEMVVPDFEKMSEEEQFELIEGWNLVIRKTAHFTEYAVLGILCALTLTQVNISLKYVGIVGGIICALYAVSDEVHQYFVPGRACRLGDVCIDTAGAVVGVMIVIVINKRRSR